MSSTSGRAGEVLAAWDRRETVTAEDAIGALRDLLNYVREPVYYEDTAAQMEADLYYRAPLDLRRKIDNIIGDWSGS